MNVPRIIYFFHYCMFFYRIPLPFHLIKPDVLAQGRLDLIETSANGIVKHLLYQYSSFVVNYAFACLVLITGQFN